jgi:hypothetical protein
VRYVSDVHRYNPRRRDDFYITTVRTSNAQNNVSVNSFRLFNLLPSSLKNVQAIGRFKFELKLYLIESMN